MRLRFALSAFSILALSACATAPAPSVEPQGIAVGEPHPQAVIQGAAMAEHVKVLASDAFEGRGPASPGEAKAIDYIITQFKAAGLEPAVNGQWLQPTPLVSIEVTNAPPLSIKGKDGVKTYAFGSQTVMWTKRVVEEVLLKDAPLVFVGYGVNAPEKNWNDYAGVDMKGKVAVMLINDPDFDGASHHLFGGKAMTYYGRWMYKYEEAARQGAAGVLIVHETAPAAYPWPVVQSSWTGPQFDTARENKGMNRVLVEGWMNNEVSMETFKRADLDFAKLKAEAQQPGFKAVPMKLTASVTLKNKFGDTTSNNVIGVLRGTEHPDEVIMYGAHHDHLGHCEPVNGDDICNGATDNALGVATILEIAKRYQGQGPAKRSVAFIAFAAEEQGLLGSAYYAQNPVFPPNKTVTMINIDGGPTAGRVKNVIVVGYGQNEMQDILIEKARAQGRVVTPEDTPERGSFYRSDHFNFAKIGVPPLYMGSGLDLVDGGVARGRALNDDYLANRYHKPDDEYSDDWNLDGAADDAELLYAVGRAVADSDIWPAWKEGSEFKAIREKSLSGQ